MFKKTLVPITSLSKTYQAACQVAIATSANAYAPYSEFHVGACFVHPDGTLTGGCNYENCTFQATCAERCAMVSANASGRRAAVAVAVYGTSNKPDVKAKIADDEITPPCGLCRQHMTEVAELSGVDLDIVLVSHDQKQAALVKLSSLIPAQFGPSAFGHGLDKYRPAAAATASKQQGGD
jgi:cytidine deaminase